MPRPVALPPSRPRPWTLAGCDVLAQLRLPGLRDVDRDAQDHGRPRGTIATRSAVSSACETTSGAISSATRFMTLISGLSAGPAVSLNGSPTVSPMTAALWLSRALAAVVALLDVLLRVVPRAAGVRQHDGQQLPGEDRAGQEPAERLALQEEAGEDRREHRQQARRHQLAAARSSCRCPPRRRSPASRCSP